jgi:serine/threonine protein kinase
MAQWGHWEGRQLGKYRLLQVLGKGYWASVYLGEHQHLHTQAAIKVLHEPLAPAQVEDFLGEARTLARYGSGLASYRLSQRCRNRRTLGPSRTPSGGG